MQITRKITAVLLAVLLLLPVPAYAKDDEVFNEKAGPYKNGWTVKRQEAAEVSLGITDWSDMGNFVYTGSALAAVRSANNASKYQSGGKYYKEVTNALKKYKGVYSKQLYRTLILAMIASIQQKAKESVSWDDEEREIARGDSSDLGNFLDDPLSFNENVDERVKNAESDICYTALIYGMDDLPGSETESIDILCRHFFQAERTYLKGSSVSLTDYDLADDTSNGLKVIIQGTIYGTDYISKTTGYSADKAGQYRDSHSNLIDWDSFADDVAGKTYLATKVKNGMDHVIEF